MRVLFLELAHPIDVCGDSRSDTNKRSFNNVKNIQLFYLDDSLDAQRFLNHQVVVTGTLFEKLTAHHYTDVLLRVRTIRPAAGK